MIFQPEEAGDNSNDSDSKHSSSQTEEVFERRANLEFEDSDEDLVSIDKNVLENLKSRSNQLDNIIKERDQYRQQLEEIADLEDVMTCLKKKADMADSLMAENQNLKQQQLTTNLNYQPQISRNLEAENSFLKMKARDCEQLEAELALFKAKYEELRIEKKDLREQLQIACGYQAKYEDLRKKHKCEMQFYEEKIENLANMFDKQDLELKKKDSYIRLCNQRLSTIGSIKKDVSYLQVSEEIGSNGASTIMVRSIESNKTFFVE